MPGVFAPALELLEDLLLSIARGFLVCALEGVLTEVELFKMLELSLDVLDRLYRPDRGCFFGTVSNNLF